MVCDGEVLLDISKVVRIDVGNRVLLAIECALLKCKIQFGECQRRRRSAECLEDRDGHLVLRCTDLKTCQICGSIDRLLAVGDLSEAVLPVCDLDHVAALKICNELFADLTVENFVNALIVREQERKSQSVDLRAIVRDLSLRKHHGVEGAHLNHFSHLSVGTELLCCVDVYLNFSSGLLVDILREILKRYMDQVCGCIRVTDLDRVLSIAAAGVGCRGLCAGIAACCI